MGRNIMRTPEEKERIILEMINNGYGFHTMSKKYDISKSVLSKWYYSYKEKGIEGLKSNTGKHNSLNTGLYLKKPKNKIEELELELMKKDIEIARLKKGYMVKGVGAKKEFVTILDKNTK
ncbi:MAG: helix-turn-helix domain-containing protein [Bacilli bacterium]|jgi:transposase|nr:helix-turn-helix domain-containing protein [Bacilli bacterium]